MTEEKRKIECDVINSKELEDRIRENEDELWFIKSDEETGEIIEVIHVTPDWIAKHVK